MAATDVLDRSPEELAGALVERHGAEWLDGFSEALDRRRAGDQLQRVLEVWGLNQSAAASVFGVSRQAVSKWLRHGVPAERVPAVADLAAATDLLVRQLKRDRIPAVVRRESPAVGGSLLDLTAGGRTREVLEVCRAMFDFHRAHA